MHARRSMIHAATAVLIGCAAAKVQAQVNFGNNDITFNPPVVVGGNAVATVAVQGPKKVKLVDGERIIQLSYTVTSVNRGEVDLSWDATRQFNLAAGSTLDIRNVGSTQITMAANNRVDLIVNATVDGLLANGVGFISPTLNGPLAAREITWDNAGSEPRPAGNHTLQIDSGIVWQPNAVGDTIVVSSFYQANVGAIRVRTNYKNLSATQRSQYVEAVKAMKAKAAKPNYDTFVSSHFMTLYTIGHKGSLFLPWHRQFLYEFETLLVNTDVHTAFDGNGDPITTSATVKFAAAVGGLPYWDWRDPFPDFLGKVDGVDGNFAVNDGPFQKGKWVITEQAIIGANAADRKNLHRYFGKNKASSLDPRTMAIDIATTLMVPNYDVAPYQSQAGLGEATNINNSFRNALEGWVSPDNWFPMGYMGYKAVPRMHNRAHDWVGGNMGNPASATNDPAFWLHHNFVDKLWLQWQQMNPTKNHYDPGVRPGTDKIGLFDEFEKLEAFPNAKGKAPFDTLSVKAMGYRFDDLPGPPTGLCCVTQPNGVVLQFENFTESQKNQIAPPRIQAGSTKSWFLGMTKADDQNKNCTLDDDEIKAGAKDCNTNGIPDDAETDCNSDGTLDVCQTLPPGDDCDTNGLSDVCETDCNTNGMPDICEVFTDCNSNGIPDACDLRTIDCNTDGTIDGCEINIDCNTNGIPDLCDRQQGLTDCDTNGTLDACDIGVGGGVDCDVDETLDVCELASGAAGDCNTNGTVDACDADCNTNGSADICDIASGVSQDCNGDGTPAECHVRVGGLMDCDTDGTEDECEIALDCNSDGVPDVCQLLDGDCNTNGILDSCEIAMGALQDCDGNGVPNICEICGDLNGDGAVDGLDYSILLSSLGHTVYEPQYSPAADVFYDGTVDCQDLERWLCCYRDFVGSPSAPPPAAIPPVPAADCNTNGTPDLCESPACLLDCNTNGTPDVCESGPPSVCAGDLDHDGDIDGNDFALFLLAFGRSSGQGQYNAEADLDHDGSVTLVDYQIWLQLYHACQTVPGVPVPSDLGDVNADGIVDAQDIQPFIDRLLNPGLITFRDHFVMDCNTDGQVSPADVSAFVSILLNPTP